MLGWGYVVGFGTVFCLLLSAVCFLANQRRDVVDIPEFVKGGHNLPMLGCSRVDDWRLLINFVIGCLLVSTSQRRVISLLCRMKGLVLTLDIILLFGCSRALQCLVPQRALNLPYGLHDLEGVLVLRLWLLDGVLNRYHVQSLVLLFFFLSHL